MKTSIWNIALSLSVSLAAGACSALEEDGPDPEEPPELGTAETGKEMQGRFILGELMDDVPGEDADHHFSVSLSGATPPVHFIDSAALDIASGTLNAPGGDTLTFTRVGPQRDVSSYTIRIIDAQTQQPFDPCDGGTATPLLGIFSRDRAHEYDEDRLSFACRTGSADKCIKWGYKPGGDPTDRETWQAHEACAQEANAGYCADNKSYTLEETTIALADFVGVRGPPPATLENATDWPPPPTDFYYEGAYRVGHQKVFCLARARWSDLPLGGPDGCPLDDPRLGVGNYCEEYDWDDKRETGNGTLKPPPDVVVLNASAYNVLGLHMWRSGADHVATIQGYADGGGRPNIVPFPVGSWTHVKQDAVLLRRPTPDMVPTTVLARIYIGPNNDRVLGPDNTQIGWPPAGYAPPTGAPPEGYLFTDDTWPGTVPLYLYSRTINGTQTEYLSATSPPAQKGYTQALTNPLGWVFAPTK